MGAAVIATGPFRRMVDTRLVGKNSDDLIEEYGVATWSGASAVVDWLALSYVCEVLTAEFTPIKATGYTAADGPISTDGTVDTSRITVAREGHAEDVASYYYRILGKPKNA